MLANFIGDGSEIMLKINDKIKNRYPSNDDGTARESDLCCDNKILVMNNSTSHWHR